MKIATDISQGIKLAEILPIESADMFWLVTYKPKLHVRDDEPLSNYNRWEHYPAWSLSALLGILKSYTLQTVPDGCLIGVERPSMAVISMIQEEPIDACCNAIDMLHKHDLL